MSSGQAENIAPDEQAVDAFVSRVLREQKAREAAEALADEKNRELLEINRAHEQLLSGSIKLLTQVLAMAKPELFQKAEKIQRWARLLSNGMKVENPKELDLAAILYPIGIISLPDNIAHKYAKGAKLAADEKAMIDESQKTAFKLVDNIPHMQGVAMAIYYARKGYDGSEFPHDGIRGPKIPQSARILKILIDLADASTGISKNREGAFMHMAGQKQLYDLDILKVVYLALFEGAGEGESSEAALTLDPTVLHPGDILCEDIIDAHNSLLLASGAELTEISIKRLVAMWREQRFTRKVKVVREKQ